MQLNHQFQQIKQKLGEIYAGGLNRNQKILLGVVLVLLIILFFLWINRPFENKINPGSETELANIVIPSQPDPHEISNQKPEPAKSPVKNIYPKESYNAGKTKPAQQTPIPDTPYNPNKAEVAPGPMDETIAEIKKDYKGNPKYDLIIGYLTPLKEIADGRRAWNAWFEQSALELFGGKKGREIEAEIQKINGNKEARIRNLHFDTLDEVSSAIKKDTENYIEKGAISGFLDHARAASDGKYPWNEKVASLGEIDLEKAWVEQVDARVRPIKDSKAKKFQTVSYRSMSQLVVAIKEDTKNYEQTLGINMYLDYLNDLYKNHKLTESEVIGGSNMLENYHLAELKKFVNK